MSTFQEVDRTGKVIVDLDDNTVEEDGQMNFSLPSTPKNQLIKELTRLEQEFKSSRQKNAWEKTVIEIQRAFFNFTLFLINDYVQFYKQDVISQIENAKTEEELEIIRNQKYEIDQIFDIQAYLKMFPVEDQTFMKEFTENTMVNDLLLYQILFTFFFFKKKMFPFFIGQSFEVIFLKKFQRKSILEFQESLQMVKNAKQSFGPRSYSYYIDFESDSISQGLINSQNKYIAEVLNKKEEKLSIYPYLIKWLKYLELGKLENFEGKKKKAKPVSFWKRFWGENILHFVNAEQRQQNRDQLNSNTMLYKPIDPKKFLNLQELFEKSIFSTGSFSLINDPKKLPIIQNTKFYNIKLINKDSSQNKNQILLNLKGNQEGQDDDSPNSNNSASGLANNLSQDNQGFLSQQFTPVNQRKSLFDIHQNNDLSFKYMYILNLTKQHFIDFQLIKRDSQSRKSQSQADIDSAKFSGRVAKKHQTTINYTVPKSKQDEKLNTMVENKSDLLQTPDQNLQQNSNISSRTSSVYAKPLDPIQE